MQRTKKRMSYGGEEIVSDPQKVENRIRRFHGLSGAQLSKNRNKGIKYESILFHVWKNICRICFEQVLTLKILENIF